MVIKCDDDQIWVNTSTLNMGEYRIQVINRPDRREGDLVLISKATLKTKLLDSGQIRSFEYVVWEVKCKNAVTTVTQIYHPQYSVHNPVTNAMFTDDFTDFMNDIQQWRMNNYILGDFNLNLEMLKIRIPRSLRIHLKQRASCSMWASLHANTVTF